MPQNIDSGLVPRADAKPRDRLLVIKKIFDRASREGGAFFKDTNSITDYMKAAADMALIAAAMYPEDVDLQLQVPSTLLLVAGTLEGLREGDSRDELDIARYTGESLISAARTVERFPDVGMAYGKLAFVLSRTGGSKEETRKLYKRCVDLNRQAEFCKDGYRFATQAGAE